MTELKELIEVFTNISDEKDMNKLFNEIFTDAEKKDFASRWGLMKDLNNGMSQRSIAKKRHISLCKITRGAKLLKNNRSITKDLIKPYC